jgi:hypothetical protein
MFADRLDETSVVEPVGPSQGGDLDRIVAAPRALAADELGLEAPYHRLGHALS